MFRQNKLHVEWIIGERNVYFDDLRKLEKHWAYFIELEEDYVMK